MTTKYLIFGTDDPALVEANSGYLDDTQVYDLLGRSDKLAIAGIGGEVAHHALHLGILHEHRVVVRVTPIVDNIELDASTYTLTRPTSRRLRLLKVPIRRSFPSSVANAATLGKFAARGAWIECKVETVHAVEVLGTVTTALTGANNDLVFTAKAGYGGAPITITYVDPGAASASLSVSVSGFDITVSLATNGSSVIASTASAIATAIAALAGSNALVTVANAPANSGAGVVTAMSALSLAGGVDAPGYIAVEGCEVEHNVVRQSTTSGSNK